MTRLLGNWAGAAKLPVDVDAAMQSAAANGRRVWECYVVGLDPEKADDDFKITAFPMKSDGTPDLEAITFSPAQAKWNVAVRGQS